MSIEQELQEINNRLDCYATMMGLSRKDFLNTINTCDPKVIEVIKPLLREKIILLKALWNKEKNERGYSNLKLFTRVR